MKSIFVLLNLGLFIIYPAFSQNLPFYKRLQTTETKVKAPVVDASDMNILKLNPGKLILGSMNLSCERIFSQHQSLNVRAKYHSLGFIERSFGDFSTSGDNYTFGLTDHPHFHHFGIDAEYRFYIKNKKAARGFYIAPYARYLNTAGKFNSQYSGTVTGSHLQINGQLKTSFNIFGTGVQTGVQWLIKDKVSIDWSFLGLGADWYVFKVGVRSDNLQNTVDKYSNDLQNVLGGVSGFLSRKLAFNALDKELSSKVPFWMVGWKSSLTVGFAF